MRIYQKLFSSPHDVVALGLIVLVFVPPLLMAFGATICACLMRWFAGCSLWFDHMGKDIPAVPGVLRSVAALVSVLCFQISHFFFRRLRSQTRPSN